MSDYLGTKRFCYSCDYCDDDLVCTNDKSDFTGLNVKSVVMTGCHSKYEKGDE